ncbi:MAG: flagellar biosynthesis anti-sigma factor FlgM [Dehalococcoidia bacterium]|nr:flagellar biosynthesis anti-sigma factor FlgM [Dehalococcoidia bacterium]
MVQSVRPQDASGVYRRSLGEVGQAGGAAQTRTGGAVRARRSDSVALSEQARLLARTLEAAEAASDVRPELVESLRTRVNDGTYSVNANQIAARMLQAATNGTTEGVQA